MYVGHTTNPAPPGFMPTYSSYYGGPLGGKIEAVSEIRTVGTLLCAHRPEQPSLQQWTIRKLCSSPVPLPQFPAARVGEEQHRFVSPFQSDCRTRDISVTSATAYAPSLDTTEPGECCWRRGPKGKPYASFGCDRGQHRLLGTGSK
jgi:hypothetical protein